MFLKLNLLSVLISAEHQWEKCHRETKGRKWFREGRVWAVLYQSSMFCFITTHFCSWPLSCKCPLPFPAVLRWLSGLCFIKPHWRLLPSHTLHPPNSIYSRYCWNKERLLQGSAAMLVLLWHRTDSTAQRCITWEVLFSLSRIRSFTSRTRDAML